VANAAKPRPVQPFKAFSPSKIAFTETVRSVQAPLSKPLEKRQQSGSTNVVPSSKLADGSLPSAKTGGDASVGPLRVAEGSEVLKKKRAREEETVVQPEPPSPKRARVAGEDAAKGDVTTPPMQVELTTGLDSGKDAGVPKNGAAMEGSARVTAQGEGKADRTAMSKLGDDVSSGKQVGASKEIDSAANEIEADGKPFDKSVVDDKVKGDKESGGQPDGGQEDRLEPLAGKVTDVKQDESAAVVEKPSGEKKSDAASESVPAGKKEDGQNDGAHEYDSDDDEAPLDLAAMSTYEYEQVAKLNPVQLRRYEQYRRSDLKNAKVKKVLLSLNPALAKASEQYIIAVKGLAKLFVGDVVESALEVKKQLDDKGALQPKHLREAYRRLRRQGVIPTPGDKSGSIG